MNHQAPSSNTTLPEPIALPSTNESEFETRLKLGIWSLGNACWLFGIADRSIAVFSDGYLSTVDIAQLLTALLLFAAWLLLKPNWKPLNRHLSK